MATLLLSWSNFISCISEITSLQFTHCKAIDSVLLERKATVSFAVVVASPISSMGSMFSQTFEQSNCMILFISTPSIITHSCPFAKRSKYYLLYAKHYFVSARLFPIAM